MLCDAGSSSKPALHSLGFLSFCCAARSDDSEQALNKRVAPERFTEGDARAVRTLAPAIAAGSRLIVSLLNYSRSGSGGNNAGGGGKCGETAASFVRSRGAESSSPEELLLLYEGLRRAREGLGADRVRLFVLDPASEVAADGGGRQLQLQLWHEDPAPPRSFGWARSSSSFRGNGGGGPDCITGEGLHGVALSTGRAARSADALSDPLYDRETDVKEGFLARSVLCAPLLERRPGDVEDANRAGGRDDGRSAGGVSRGAAMGVLELTLGRGALLFDGGQSVEANMRALQTGLGESGTKRTRKAFVEGDEPLAEAFARDIARLLSQVLAAGFRPRASATALAGGGGHLGAMGGVGHSWGQESEAGGRAIWQQRRQQGQERSVAGVGDEPAANGGRLTRADLDRPRSRQQNYANIHEKGEAATAGGVETRDRVVGGQFGSSSTSTAVGVSPLGAGVRASVETAGQKTPDDGLPPPSPATDGSTYGGSPKDHPSPHGQVSEEHGSGSAGAVIVNGGVKPQERQQQQRQQKEHQKQQQQQVEATQAQSWATAHRVLEACKESLAADKRSRQHQPDCSVSVAATASSTNMKSVAPAVCSLVSSLLPGCTAVLLLLDRNTGRLREAGSGMHLDGETAGPPLPTPPRPVQQEDLARRALASGKALLSRVSESTDAAQDDDSTLSGRRIFCVPVCGSADRKFGVLQLFLPPPPPPPPGDDGGGASAASAPLSPSSLRRANPGKVTAPWTGSTSPPLPLPPPPPSFFMAAKMVSDSAGLVLGWCEALDRKEKTAEAESSALVKAAKAAATAREQSHAELEARHKEELRLVRQSHAARAADAADTHARVVADTAEAHARAVASLLEGVAKTMAAARGKRQAARVLVAWREASKRAQKSESNLARIRERKRKKAFGEWRSRTSALQTYNRVEATGAEAFARRGLRRAIGKWTRAVARRRFVEERRLAGARLLAELVRRRGPVKRWFDVWKVASQGVLAARQALARKDADEKREALIDEVNACFFCVEDPRSFPTPRLLRLVSGLPSAWGTARYRKLPPLSILCLFLVPFSLYVCEGGCLLFSGPTIRRCAHGHHHRLVLDFRYGLARW